MPAVEQREVDADINEAANAALAKHAKSHNWPLSIEEKSGFVSGFLASLGEIERLRAALRSIAEKCPVTCDMTLAHMTAEEAESGLEGRQ